MSTRTKTNEVSLLPAAGFVLVGAWVCFLAFTGISLGEPPQGATRPPGYADLLRILDCATRPDQPLAVMPEFYANGGFQLRYIRRVEPPGHEDASLELALYHRDGSSAALFEVGLDGRASNRTFVLRDGANLEKLGTRWVVQDILNGGAATWREIARLADAISATPLVAVPRSAVRRTNAACEFPPPGDTFFAVSIRDDQSNWKFKGGASEGIPLKTHSGPFDNSDLKAVPSRKVYMNTYGP
jgi:hypothetical protein